MIHTFSAPVVLGVEFTTESGTTTLSRVVEIRLDETRMYYEFLGKDEGGEPEIMAKYHHEYVRGWYIQRKLA
jgi:hypothetical protein